MSFNFIRIKRALVYRSARLFSDRKYLEILFPLRIGYPLNLDHPKTFNEKLQWLKLHDHRPEYTQMVDKVEAKKYVANIIGEEYIIPTLEVFESAEDIDFDIMPDQFVLKCTHDSGSVIVCRDKSKLDKKKTKKILAKALNNNYFYAKREYPYKDVKPRILAEQYLENPDGSALKDYKFYCFDGAPVYCQVISDRQTRTSMDFFDRNWLHQPFHKTKGYPFAEKLPKRPINHALMLNLAARLSSGHPFLRVDFYEIDGQVYFGELTFYPASGMGAFSPMEWDYKFGELIHLPERYDIGGVAY